MEVIIILWIIFTIYRAVKKDKARRAQQEARRAANGAPPQAAGSADTAAQYDPWDDGAQPGAGGAYAAKDEGMSAGYDDGCIGGSLPHDHEKDEGLSAGYDDGCIGGSLPHSHLYEEDTARIRKDMRRSSDGAYAAPSRRASLRRGVNRKSVRDAVVMSEVLARPKALRRG